MAWRCDCCTRYWGYCHKGCPLCKLRLAVRIFLRRMIPDTVVRELILHFIGSKATVKKLPLTSLCFLGTPRNCRCNRCRNPTVYFNDDPILRRLARKTGRGRAIASRWVYLLSGIVALRAGHGILHGMLLAANCGRGPHVRFLMSPMPKRLCEDIRPWVWRWLTALFLQYVEDRSDLRSLLGTATSVLFNISIT